MMFEKGQRVRYIGTYSPDLKGEEGVVTSQQVRDNNVNVRFNSDRLNRGRDLIRGVKPENIELIPEIFKYDPKQAGDQDDDI